MAIGVYRGGPGPETVNRKSGGGGVGTFGGLLAGGGRYTSAHPVRSVIKGPSIGDFGNPGPRPIVGTVDRGAFGGTDPAAASAFHDISIAKNKSMHGFNDPTSTAAFRNLMNLESEQGAAVEGEVARSARDAASRAGYSGGFGARSRQAQQDRFQSIAEGGMAASAQIRKEEGDKYAGELAAQTSLANGINAQTGAANNAFGNALASRNETQANTDLGFGKLINDRNLSFADAKAEASRLQAQLDSAFQNQLIDAGRYNQINASIAAQLETERAKAAEEKRRFDLTRGDLLERDKTTRADTQAELDKQRRERGVDPVTGRHYGNANPAPGGSFSSLM